MTLPIAPIAGTGLLKVGASLLGGLLGRKKKGPSWAEQVDQKRQLEQQRFMWLRQGAENAGFNPLSVLNATGGGMAVNPQVSSPLSTRAIVGDAIRELGGSLGDPMDRERDQLDLDLAKEELELVRQQRERLSTGERIYNSPVKYSEPEFSPDVTDTLVGATAFGDNVSVSDARDEALQARKKDEGLKNAYRWRLPSYLPSAEHIEGIHGDVGGAIYGLATLPAALGSSIARPLAEAKERSTGYSFKSGGQLYKMYEPPEVKRRNQNKGNMWVNPEYKGPFGLYE